MVATLALFVALGGSSAALVTLTGRDIKNRSIKRVDVRRNTLTGGEIREGRLAKVPAASRADEATSATTAGFTEEAGNAARLEGLGAAAFARAVQVDSGSGDNTATSQTTLVSFPDIGFEVRTDGDADSSNQLRFVNSRGEGQFLYWSTGSPNAVGVVGAGVNFEAQGPAGSPLNHDVVFALQSGSGGLEPSPVISITCRFSVPPTVACIGIRSL